VSGIFASLARRICATVLMSSFCSTLRPVFSKIIRTVACFNFMHKERHLYCTLFSLEMLNYCFAFQKEICSFKMLLIEHLKIKPVSITSRYVELGQA